MFEKTVHKMMDLLDTKSLKVDKTLIINVLIKLGPKIYDQDFNLKEEFLTKYNEVI